MFAAKNNCDCDFTKQKEHYCIGFAQFYSDKPIKLDKETKEQIIEFLSDPDLNDIIMEILNEKK